MKRYLRKITKRSRGKFEHSLSIPADFVRELDVSDCIVELKLNDGKIIISKMKETNDSASKDESDEDFTVH